MNVENTIPLGGTDYPKPAFTVTNKHRKQRYNADRRALQCVFPPFFVPTQPSQHQTSCTFEHMWPSTLALFPLSDHLNKHLITHPTLPNPITNTFHQKNGKDQHLKHKLHIDRNKARETLVNAQQSYDGALEGAKIYVPIESLKEKVKDALEEYVRANSAYRRAKEDFEVNGLYSG